MSPTEKTEAAIGALVAAIRADIAAARARVLDCSSEIGDGERSPTRAAVAFAAVSLDRAYTAIEAAFLRVARAIDEAVPTGEAWHAALVHQMTLAIADRRGAILTVQLAERLEPLRRHRHWMRHAYAATFEWSRMKDVALSSASTIEAACASLETFAASL